MSKAIARAPAQPPEYNPNAPRYWEERDLEHELKRTFQICQDCRMCVTYCGSFPILFDAVDQQISAGLAEGAETVSSATIAAVSDHCWQCKLCYIKCPYTPDEGAYEALDFPRLMAREKAQRARRSGIPIVDQVLGEPQLIGALGAGPTARLANIVNANRLVRKVAEKAFGISAEFPLPPLATRAFGGWFARHSAQAEAGQAGSVALFPTCYGEYNF
ncbi:MAG TPA: 4Fe-4S dicluster domain-containing protein, partial [Polyangiaceae bacterium]|nr:4Fe-4S dicluster domain-containing protein [Polyangiaceae bacterium]